MIILGVDPGLHGGVAKLECIGGKIVKATAISMPVKDRELDLAEIVKFIQGADHCFIEKVWGHPGGSSKSLCTTCLNYGKLLALIWAECIPCDKIPPRTWQAKILSKGCLDTKAASIAVCQEKFPEVNLTPGRKRKAHDGMADALCIALYGWLYII
ncbi:MAG: hypothetical protein DRH50_12825 [Deltaproteobacteria bacterium]|nr:MAG: hypothetical protein DRH50_12825 [Deltaproteobacteria bacterium]